MALGEENRKRFVRHTLKVDRVTFLRADHHVVRAILGRRCNCFDGKCEMFAIEHASTNERDGDAAKNLAGIPYSLKDNIDVTTWRTTCHSSARQDVVADKDNDVFSALRDAAAVLIGKNSLHELATGGPSLDLPWPPARNPWDSARHPGWFLQRVSRRGGRWHGLLCPGYGYRRVRAPPGQCMRHIRLQAYLRGYLHHWRCSALGKLRPRWRALPVRARSSFDHGRDRGTIGRAAGLSGAYADYIEGITARSGGCRCKAYASLMRQWEEWTSGAPD